jgi:hypothetical protein
MKRTPKKLNLFALCIPLIITLILTGYAFWNVGTETGLMVGFISLFVVGGLEGLIGIGWYLFKKWTEQDGEKAKGSDMLMKTKEHSSENTK